MRTGRGRMLLSLDGKRATDCHVIVKNAYFWERSQKVLDKRKNVA